MDSGVSIDDIRSEESLTDDQILVEFRKGPCELNTSNEQVGPSSSSLKATGKRLRFKGIGWCVLKQISGLNIKELKVVIIIS